MTSTVLTPLITVLRWVANWMGPWVIALINAIPHSITNVNWTVVQQFYTAADKYLPITEAITLWLAYVSFGVMLWAVRFLFRIIMWTLQTLIVVADGLDAIGRLVSTITGAGGNALSNMAADGAGSGAMSAEVIEA